MPPAAIRLSAVSDDSYDAAIFHEIGHFQIFFCAKLRLDLFLTPC
jgi:hypothetical protein